MSPKAAKPHTSTDIEALRSATGHKMRRNSGLRHDISFNIRAGALLWLVCGRCNFSHGSVWLGRWFLWTPDLPPDGDPANGVVRRARLGCRIGSRAFQWSPSPARFFLLSASPVGL
jgi:hypothetical protein